MRLPKRRFGVREGLKQVFAMAGDICGGMQPDECAAWQDWLVQFEAALLPEIPERWRIEPQVAVIKHAKPRRAKRSQ